MVLLNHLNVEFSSRLALSVLKLMLVKRLSVALAMLAFAIGVSFMVVPLVLTMTGVDKGTAAKAE